jgi:hypothetical protein
MYRSICWESLATMAVYFGRKCLRTRPSENLWHAGQSAGNQRLGGPAALAFVFACDSEGTSETTRAATSSPAAGSNEHRQDSTDPDRNFNQWLAGLIDGDGCFLMSKAGYTSCEITMGEADERALRLVQNKVSGSIKPRKGVKALRYRVHNHPGMIELVNRVNGHVRNPIRLAQLAKVCDKLGIEPRQPDELHAKHHWFAGLFDADGTITFSLKGPYQQPQLTISATNKLAENVAHFPPVFGGGLYYDKAQKGCWKWSVQSRADVLRMLTYFRACPSHSAKAKRLLLVKQFHALVAQGAHRSAPGTALHADWTKFTSRWQYQVEDIVQSPE